VSGGVRRGEREMGVVEVEGSGVAGRDDDSTGSGQGGVGGSASKYWDRQTGKILKKL
jgi:hypothetical protein